MKIERKAIGDPTGSKGILLPSTARTQDLSRDATETEWVTAFSECRDLSEKASERPKPALFPPGFAAPLKLALTTAIDTSTAGAGDVITARLLETVVGPLRSLAPEGATLTGRIMRLEHRMRKPYSFLIWVDFDTIETNGVVSSIRTRLTHGDDLDSQHPCSIATMSDQKWDRALHFYGGPDNANIVIPAGYTSRWLTGEPASKGDPADEQR